MTAAPCDVAGDSSPRPIRIGISACLLGQPVRFDGGHKRDAFLTETFGRLVEWVPICPEVECGLGTPREAMRFVRAAHGVRLFTIESGSDLTAQMERFSRSRVSALAREELSGYVLKKDSPSCGLERVKVYDRHGTPARGGRGLFAAALVEAFPHLPVEEEGRLADPRLRDNFVERVFAYWRSSSTPTCPTGYNPRPMPPIQEKGVGGSARLRTAVVTVMLSLAGLTAHGQGQVGQFQDSGDVGSPALAGTTAYNPVTQSYALSAGGTNMWANRDEFQFAWRKLSGDFILQAQIAFVGAGVDPHRKAGLIIRSTIEADSPYADAVIHGDGLTSLQFRRTKGVVTEQIESAVKGADVVQIERSGSTYVMSVAKFGQPFTTSQVADLELGDDVFVGLALCSHNPAVVERAIFSNVRIIRPAADNFRPYRDYIGSVLEVLDVTTGHRQTLWTSQQPFEAPNWTRDGALIVNTSGTDADWRGRLRRFDLATRQSTVIDTGERIRNNNDHVLSPDGKTLAISDQSLAGVGSTIYTLPVTGGAPKRITTLAPSYMHSWSPDAKSLVYTGGRTPGQGQPQNLDIYLIASDGSGPEKRLTTAPGVDDGPEYTRDGKYIYFNSSRSGLMQIWRTAPDGSNQEQVTNDSFNNWFPHVSPDGQSIMMISFPKEIDPADHPYYKRVYLRVMPVVGGTVRVVAYVYGGQGTINVPSWSPDGRMVAFVSNTGPY